MDANCHSTFIHINSASTCPSNSGNAFHQSAFCRLPSELRVKIYQFAVRPSIVFPPKQWFMQPKISTLAPGLLKTCRAIYLEACLTSIDLTGNNVAVYLDQALILLERLQPWQRKEACLDIKLPSWSNPLCLIPTRRPIELLREEQLLNRLLTICRSHASPLRAVEIVPVCEFHMLHQGCFLSLGDWLATSHPEGMLPSTFAYDWRARLASPAAFIVDPIFSQWDLERCYFRTINLANIMQRERDAENSQQPEFPLFGSRNSVTEELDLDAREWPEVSLSDFVGLVDEQPDTIRNEERSHSTKRRKSCLKHASNIVQHEEQASQVTGPKPCLHASSRKEPKKVRFLEQALEEPNRQERSAAEAPVMKRGIKIVIPVYCKEYPKGFHGRSLFIRHLDKLKFLEQLKNDYCRD